MTNIPISSTHSSLKAQYPNSKRVVENKKSPCDLRLLVGGILATLGIVLLSLGLTHIFGSVGSAGYISGVAVGGVAFLTGITLIVLSIKTWREESIKADQLKNLPPKKIEKKDPEIKKEKPKVDKQEKSQVEEEPLPADEHIIYSLAEKWASGIDISTCLKSIPEKFFENKSQERAKEAFSLAMEKVLENHVSFPKSIKINDPDNLKGQLNKNVFHVATTVGVDEAILAASQDTNYIHVFQVASQYNCSEAPNAFTPAVGTAMQTSEMDYTQGPGAQRTNPTAFELVTAFLTHLGFNMLEKVLPSGGTTYDANAPIEHGYLRPKQENKDDLTQEFEQNYSEAEFVVYESYSKDWPGSEPVHIMLQAAPASAYAGMIGELDEMEKHAALTNYAALNKYGLDLAKKTGRHVVLHPTAIGGGVFHNQLPNLIWGFEKSGLALQDQMETAHVFVQLESRDPKDNPALIGKALNLDHKARLGA